MDEKDFEPNVELIPPPDLVADPDGCNFSFTTIFGGIDLRVPEDWSVVTSGTSIFGGISNKTISRKDDKITSVNLNGIVLFGGIEIKN